MHVDTPISWDRQSMARRISSALSNPAGLSEQGHGAAFQFTHQGDHMKHSAVAALLLALVVQPALAANEYSAPLKAKKYAEVERMSNAKLSAEPNNADALIAKSKAILAQNVESRFDEAAKLAEQCIAAHPQRSDCHEALGEALGSKAMAGGIMSAIGYAGKIRDAFQKAVELDTNNLTARSSLQQYYVMAPGIAGGSTDKAQSLAV
jgi:tetratricopeptide (TPR) repeat protein